MVVWRRFGSVRNSAEFYAWGKSMSYIAGTDVEPLASKTSLVEYILGFGFWAALIFFAYQGNGEKASKRTQQVLKNPDLHSLQSLQQDVPLVGTSRGSVMFGKVVSSKSCRIDTVTPFNKYIEKYSKPHIEWKDCEIVFSDGGTSFRAEITDYESLRFTALSNSGLSIQGQIEVVGDQWSVSSSGDRILVRRAERREFEPDVPDLVGDGPVGRFE